jgi:hypothetical protein
MTNLFLSSGLHNMSGTTPMGTSISSRDSLISYHKKEICANEGAL